MPAGNLSPQPPDIIESFKNALLLAFSKQSDLEQLVYFALGKSLSTIVEQDNLDTMVFKLLRWAEEDGSLLKLVHEARKRRPKRPEFERLEAKLKLQRSTKLAGLPQ